MYSLYAFAGMIADTIRTDAYRRALRSLVTPKSVVVDIGAGPGIFTLFACEFGAKRVYAIEPDDAIQITAELVSSHGYANRVKTIQALSTETTLPDPADIAVSDIRGVLPLFGNHIPAVIDARERILRPGGILIPQADILSVAVIESDAIYTKATTPWQSADFSLDLSPLSARLRHCWTRASAVPEDLITPAAVLSVLDYREINEPDLDGRVTLRPRRAGIGHGFLVWFDTRLAGDIGYSNAPGGADLIYGQAFFPWSRPVALSPTDAIHARLRARLIGRDYVWFWETLVVGVGEETQPRTSFSQSSFQGEVYSPHQLAKMHQDHVPSLNRNGEVHLTALKMMEARVRLLDIARHVMSEYPTCFSSFGSALGYVADLSKKYSA
jgi:protein arginine N-methyltransferase 1